MTQVAAPVAKSAKPTLGMEGCPVHALKRRLRASGLRPTRQRVALGWLLFGKGHRHVTAEMLFEEAQKVRSPVSMATIYNTLHQFTQTGLLREIAVEGSKAFFDTNPLPHAHFLVEETGALIDVETSEFRIVQPPAAPAGYEIDRMELIIRIRKTAAARQ